MTTRMARACLLTATLGLFGAGAGLAQTVTLESNDGTIRFTGDLIEFKDGSYKVDTAIGTITVDGAAMTCIGEACPAPKPDSVDFLISGSRTLALGLMPSLIEGYSFAVDGDIVMATNSDQIESISITDLDGEKLAGISLAPGGSSSGWNDLFTGEAEIALMTRPARAAELEAAAASGLGDMSRAPFENVVALDGLLIVTSQSNPVRALSEQNIADIFAGRITNWSQVGGDNQPINLYARAEDTGTGAVFFNLVMRPNRVRVTGDATVLDSDADVSDAVANDPNGIGFTSYSNERNAKSVAIRGVCGIQTPANRFTIKTEEYPLTRRLYAYRADRPVSDTVESFLEYIASEDAQDIIAQTGFVDQAISSLSVNQMGLRFVSAVLPSDAEVGLTQLQGMMQDLIAADRMSLTFRFNPGSSDLDSRAESDILRLAGLANQGEFRNKEILLIGFTDSVGRADINANLSSLRANQVRDTFLAALDPGVAETLTITPLGYGEMSPLGCNETANGRQINRRVEVWTRDIIRG